MLKVRFALLLLIINCAAASGLYAAETEILELDEAILARLAREKLRKNAEEDREADINKKRKAADATGCGSVNIGNIIGSKRVSGSTEITVVVTGDVVNANNKCR
jgi:hypothetical protein